MRASTVVWAGMFAVIAAAFLFGQTSTSQPAKPSEDQPPPPVRYPWYTDRDWTARQKLAQRVPEVKFDARPFRDVLERLENISGVHIRPNWTALESCAIEKDAEVTLKARDALLSDVLDEALEAASGGEVELAYDIHDGAVFISTHEDLSQKTMVVNYDCTDLVRAEEADLAKYIHRVCEEIGKQRGRDVWDDAAQSERLIRQVIEDGRQQLQLELLKLVVSTVDPESWREAGGSTGTISWFGPQLVVSQRQPAQVQIFDLLTKLRDARNHQQPKNR